MGWARLPARKPSQSRRSSLFMVWIYSEFKPEHSLNAALCIRSGFCWSVCQTERTKRHAKALVPSVYCCKIVSTFLLRERSKWSWTILHSLSVSLSVVNRRDLQQLSLAVCSAVAFGSSVFCVREDMCGSFLSGLIGIEAANRQKIGRRRLVLRQKELFAC